jgi:uncharacterized protein YbaR (Trm112 family)/SAM-dependent methyltransferase
VTVDPYVQEWVAGTNGRLYIPLVHRLPRYPIPHWPLPEPGRGLMLDIGCGWGRWMVAAGRQGYLPVGIDVKLEPLQAARRVLDAHGVRGYVVAADLSRLPFRPGVFSLAFSYSALQHVSRDRAARCVGSVRRLLRGGGTCLFEFPTRCGIGRVLRLRLGREPEDADPVSWCVRYYSRTELRQLFVPLFDRCDLLVDCYLGIGVQAADVDLVPWPAKAVVMLSEMLKRTAGWLPPLRALADSVYVRAAVPAANGEPDDEPMARLRAGDGSGRDPNLAVAALLVCPASGGPLEVDEAGGVLVSRRARLAYPVVDGIPVLLPESARPI